MKHPQMPISATADRPSHSKVSGQDFNMFHAIVGSLPVMEPQAAERAAAVEIATCEIWRDEGKARHKRNGPHPLIRFKLTPRATLLSHLRDLDMAHWLRQISSRALRRLDEAHRRLQVVKRAINPTQTTGEITK